MSILSTSLRRARCLPSAPIGIRALSSTPAIAAAPITAPSSTPTPRYVRKTPVPTRSAAGAGNGASGYRSTYTPRARTAAPAQSAPAPVQDLVDDFPDLPPSEMDDYAHLTPTASPPLTSLPTPGTYDPLPSAPIEEAGTSRIAGEAPVGADWSTSFSGLSERPFDKEVAAALLKPLSPEDVEVKPDGLLYLPEIKYRRTLNAAFGPGGWGLAPRGETHVGPRIVSREWGLVCLGRLVSVARGEQEYFDASGIPTATEACKSNALMRCCKDLGIASELWDPTFIRDFKKQHCVEVFTEHATRRTKKKLWRKKNAPKFEYPYKE